VRKKLLKALVEVAGPSGREDRVRDIVRPELEKSCDRVDQDALGNLVGVRDGSGGPRLVLAAHMDEIGLMVTHIDDRGFLKFIPLGGWDPRTLVGQRVKVRGRRDLPGVVGARAIHLQDEAERGKAPKLEGMAIDLGMTADEVRELVRPGDTATRTRDLMEMGALLTAKSMDDRVGVFVMLEAMAKAKPSPCEVHAAATAQEEVGLRGARVAASRARPDIGVAIDTCPSDDGPGGGSDGPGARIGKGAAIRIADASALASPALVDLLTQLAEERKIPHQFHVSNKGGTDTQSLQLAAEGCIAGCISIPTRYVHSSVEACHPDDIEACVALTVALIEEGHRLIPTE
jgi:tetrahedral aminopeptidase